MPLPRVAAQLSTRLLSPVMRHVSGSLPGFATIEHVGRRSGKTYRSPVNVFFRGGQAAFALTYGGEAHWVQNVLAAGTCRMQSRGRWLRLDHPELIVDTQRRPMPRWLRPMLGLIGVNEFLVMDIAAHDEDPATRTGPGGMG